MSICMRSEIQKHLRFNVVINLLDGAFFGLGLGISSFSAFIPIFVNRMTDSAILIGLVPAVHAFGWQFPQIFTAGWISRMRQYKPAVVLLTLQERIPFFGLALVAWFLPALGKQNALILTFLFLTWQGLGGGFTANAWTSMICKIIPSETRGTFFGTQSAAANAFMSVGAIIAGSILSKISNRFDFSLLFLLTGLIMLVSWFFLSLTREPEDLERNISEVKNPFWRGIRTILKRDHNFRWFLFARLLSQFASMGFAFYIIYAINQFGLNEFTAGIISATLTGAAIIANPLMGLAGDRWGHRRVMLFGFLAATCSSILAWHAGSLAWFYPIMILTGMASVAIWTTPLAITAEFGNETERPIYIGLSNTLIAPAAILAPLFGGWLADIFGYPLMFLCTAGVGLLTLIIIIFFFKEPREGQKLQKIKNIF